MKIESSSKSERKLELDDISNFFLRLEEKKMEKKSFFWSKIESSSNLRSNLELDSKINEKKGPKKIKKIPGDGLEPGFEPTRGGKNDQKKTKRYRRK